LQISQRLAEADPLNPDYLNICHDYKQLGRLYSYTGRGVEREAIFKKATAFLSAWFVSTPVKAGFHINLAEGCRERAGFLRDNGNLDEALALFTRSVQTLEGVLQRERQSTEAKAQLSDTLLGRAEALVRLRREGERARTGSAWPSGGKAESHVSCGSAVPCPWPTWVSTPWPSGGPGNAARDRSPTMPGTILPVCIRSPRQPRAATLSFRHTEREQLVDQYAGGSELLSKARTTGFFTPAWSII